MTELVFILDRSGSMSGLEKDTIGGFNSMLEKQRKEPGDVVVSTVLFDNETEVIHDRSSTGTDVNGCFLRVSLETRDFAHVQEIKSALSAAGFKLL